MIWLDVSDFESWQGNLTGIQRVVFEFLSRTAASDFKFFRFDGFEFKAVKRTAFRKLESRDDVSTSTQKRRRTYFFQRMQPYAKLVGSAGMELGSAAKQFALSFLPTSARLKLGHVAAISKQKFDRRVVGHYPSPFKSGDILLFLGASWASSSLRALPLTNLGPLTTVSLVYDLVPSLFPHFFGPGFGNYYRGHIVETLQLSDRVIVISESTRNDLTDFAERFGLELPPIDVIRLGDNPSSSSPAKVSKDFMKKFDQAFVLSVGTLEIRKNYDLLCNVWTLASREEITIPPLVIVGRGGWLTSDIQYRLEHDPALRNVVWLSDCSDEELNWLYQNCLFTIYPSHYEGWGLPVAESLRYGKVCISSSASSMPEIGGDLIPYIDSLDCRGTLHAVYELAHDHKKLLDMEATIKERYRSNSWDNTFKEISDSIERAKVTRVIEGT